ncbi:MAG: phage holin family protein [Bacteroidota bacterium]|jgi:putative membrane protein|nr:phage holin family protein [Bacteroidota bacterium]
MNQKSIFWKASFQIMLTSLALLVGDYMMQRVSIDSNVTLIVAAVVIALLNRFVKPLLVLLTIPATLFTFGLFLLVINAAVLLMASELVEGFKIETFWSALGLSLIISLINALLGGDGKVKVQRMRMDNDSE